MRIWSVHPKYLDAKGMVALWRETLLAKNVLEDKTRGYKNHPQLDRFKSAPEPLDAINFYLKIVWLEAVRRNYQFDKSKYIDLEPVIQITVTTGQIDFERIHLLKKLKLRDERRYHQLSDLINFEPHPLFRLVSGEVEFWEKG